jgi:hypothetical protein
MAPLIEVTRRCLANMRGASGRRLRGACSGWCPASLQRSLCSGDGLGAPDRYWTAADQFTVWGTRLGRRIGSPHAIVPAASFRGRGWALLTFPGLAASASLLAA